MRRRLTAALLAVLAACTLASIALAQGGGGGGGGGGDPVPDKRSTPVVFVHGLSLDSQSTCAATWDKMPETFEKWGYEAAKLKIVAYYGSQLNCSGAVDIHDYGAQKTASPSADAQANHPDHHGSSHSSHTNDTDIRHIAYHLAWYIHREYTLQGETVDVVAHSMGGLVIRYAVAKVQLGDPEFPPTLAVEDAVTLGTPHGGARDLINGCSAIQCDQMNRSEPEGGGADGLLTWLKANAANPQGTGGTDWTLIGSESDQAVSMDSAVGINPDTGELMMDADHKLKYLGIGLTLNHSDYTGDVSDVRDAEVSHWHRGADWANWKKAPHVVRRTDLALTYSGLEGGDASDQTCFTEVEIEAIAARAACWKQDASGAWVTSGEVDLNGLKLVPFRSSKYKPQIRIDTDKLEVNIRDAAVEVPYGTGGSRVRVREYRNETWALGTATITADSQGDPETKYKSTLFSLSEQKIGTVAKPVIGKVKPGAKLGPLPFTGSIEIAATREVKPGAVPDVGSVELEVGLQVPVLTTRPPKVLDQKTLANDDPPSATAAVTLKLENGSSVDLDSFKVKFPSVYAGVIELEDVELEYESGGKVTGAATAEIPRPPFTSKRTFRLAVTVIPHGNGFPYVYLERAAFDVRGINWPIGGFLVMQDFRGSIAFVPGKLLPTELALGGGFTLGPKVKFFGVEAYALKLSADLELKLTQPWQFTASGTVSVFSDEFQIAQGFLTVGSGGAVDLDGSIGWSKPGYFTLQVGLTDTWFRTSAFNIGSRGSLCLEFLPGDPCATATGVVSSKGSAWCAKFTLFGGQVSAGIGYPENGDVTQGFDWMGSSCGIGPWTASKASGAANATQSVDFPGGLPAGLIGIEGRDAPPDVTITGPGGERIDAPAGPGALGKRALVTKPPGGRTTYVLIGRPSGGRWTIEPHPGSSAITRVRRANGLPEPEIDARVVGRGHRREIVYRVKPIPGQRVTFSESGRDGSSPIGSARGRRGRIRFTPTDGSAGSRRIVANVEQGGRPREAVTVASYRAPGPLVPARPRDLRAKRTRSGLRVSWRRVRGADRYLVETVSQGRRIARSTSSRRTSVLLREIERDDAARITVMGASRTLTLGAPARTRVRAVPVRIDLGPSAQSILRNPPRVACTANLRATCSFTLRMRARDYRQFAGTRSRRSVLIGRGSVTLQRGGRRIVRIKLLRRGRLVLRRASRSPRKARGIPLFLRGERRDRYERRVIVRRSIRLR